MNKICLLGLGYIGLPTGSMFALAGKNVVGVDPSPRVQAALSSGLASIDEPELQTLVTAAINSRRLRVQTHPEAADVFIIAVPTPLDERTKIVFRQHGELARHLLRGLVKRGFDVANIGHFDPRGNPARGVSHMVSNLVPEVDPGLEIPLVCVFLNEYYPPLPSAARCAQLGAGDTAHVPVGCVHSGGNVGREMGRRVVIFSPAGVEGFFLEVGA